MPDKAEKSARTVKATLSSPTPDPTRELTVQASVTNASSATFQSNQVTVNWQTASCSSSTSPQSGTATLAYIGATAGEFNESL